MKNKYIIIDTETTGFHPYDGDELLQVSIIDTDGNVLFDEYFKPQHRTEWKEAEQVNGISPEMVADRPAISEKISEINAIIENSDTIIGYNTQFDIGFLKANGAIVPDDLETVDVMEDFAKIYGEWNSARGSYKWQKLTRAAEYYGYDWSQRAETAHNSLGDCYATLFVYDKINTDTMVIERVIDGKRVGIELTPEEMRTAYNVKDYEYKTQDIVNAIEQSEQWSVRDTYISSTELENNQRFINDVMCRYEKMDDHLEDYNMAIEDVLSNYDKYYIADETKQRISDIADNCRNACELCGEQTQNDIFLSEKQALQAVKMGIPVGYVTKDVGYHGSSAGLHTFYMLSEQNYSTLKNDNSMDKGPVFHYTMTEEQKKEMLDIINAAIKDPEYAKRLELPKKTTPTRKKSMGR